MILADPVIGRAPIKVGVAPALGGRLRSMAAGRPLVIDYYASRLRGVAVGDLTVSFGEPDAEPCFFELERIDGVLVLAHRNLLGVLHGATPREAGPPWNRHLGIALAGPESWIDFLDRYGGR